MSNKKRILTPEQKLQWRVKKTRTYAKILADFHKQYNLFINKISSGETDEATSIWHKMIDKLDHELYVFTYQHINFLKDLDKNSKIN